LSSELSIINISNNVAIFLSSAKRFLEKTHEFLCLFYDAPNSSSDFKNKVKIIITVTILETNDIEKMSLNGVLCEDNLTNLDEGSAFPDVVVR
jgi:hypothetical protein